MIITPRDHIAKYMQKLMDLMNEMQEEYLKNNLDTPPSGIYMDICINFTSILLRKVVVKNKFIPEEKKEEIIDEFCARLRYMLTEDYIKNERH